MTELKNYLDIEDIEVGIDEAGLGCVAGSCFVSGVILPKECPNKDYIKLWTSIKDSKKVKKEKRFELADYIKEIALDWTVVEVTNKQIDKTNILKERLNAYHKVVRQLMIEPDNILVDGDKFNPYPGIPHICIEKGDNKFNAIAAASILAKTSKDNHIMKLHTEYPVYSWDTNCGYLTKSHKESILEYGITLYHRRTFGICKQWRSLPQNYL
jgi:ribonuclease HII